MNKKKRLFNLLIIAALFLGACNLPSGSQGEELSMTAAAQTVESMLSVTPAVTNTDTPLPVPTTLTSTPLPDSTNTPTAPATSTCNVAQFISDITIPDGTVMTPGQAFTKKWRIKNIGSCAWNGYSLVFDSGDSMGGPASTPITSVNPGQEVDLEVNLTAPVAPDNYKGYWRITTNGSVLVPVVNGYQGKSFYVLIKVQGPATATNALPSSHTVNLAYLAGESGLVLSDGSVNPLTVAAGDSLGNLGVEAFLSFDISGVPSGSTIQAASLLLKGGSQVRGDPFATLGCLRAYVQNYGVVDGSDFVPAGALSAITRWCNSAELEAPYSDAGFISAVQGAVGSSRFQIRLQFKDILTDGDGNIDDVLILAPVTLTITYSP